MRLAAPWVLTAILVGSPAHAEIDPDLLAGLSARSIGPAGMSGRVADIEVVASNPNIMYVGAATGGVWKSVDGGLRWEPIFDDQPVVAIGAVAVNQKHPDIVWVGTGEGNLRNSVSIGNGVYRSLDAGRTWTYLGLPESERVHRILLHPDDPDVAFVAVPGKLWGDSEERGVFRTTDGGETWDKVLYVDERTGCSDLVMDPSNPRKLIAAMHEFRRWPWFFESGGPGSGIYVTLDGGETWTERTPDDGLPEGDLGRMGLAIAPSNPDVVYAWVEAKENVVLRSTDGGATFGEAGKHERMGNRPFYYADIRVDPQDPDRVYSLWSLVSVSEDGGKTFRVIVPWSKLHPDHHAMWIHPEDGNFIVEGNDGGVGISTDRGETWRFVSNLPVAQYYHIAVDMDLPYHIYGGMQDNGSWRGPSTVWENGGIRNHHWEEVGFGDGFDTRPYPKDSQQGYAMSQEGYVQRWNLRTGERRAIRPAAPEGEKLRFNWNAGIAQDPFDHDTIYFGSQYVHKSTDRGDSWERISDDLTTDNPDWQKQDDSGGLTPDVTGAENFVSVVAIAPSELQEGLLWVGTDDGRFHVTRDGGGTWTSLEKKVRGVPANTWIPHIDASPHDAGTAFVVFDDHRRSNIEPYVYRTTEFGAKWENLATDEIDGYCLVIEQDPVNPDLLFLGTEFGLYVSLNAGRNWMKWTHGVPTVSVMDLVVHPREHDLVLGTHGRAAFVLDDIRPLRTLTAATMAEPLHLFDVAPAQQYRVRQTGASRFPGATEFRGRNRAYGALINFSLNVEGLPHPDEDKERERKAAERERKAVEKAEKEKEQDKDKPKDDKKPEAEFTVHDADGNEIRTFKREVHQGLNRVSWNLGRDPFKRPSREPEGPGGGGGSGPQVLPGEYEITVKYEDHEATTSVTVLADPREELTMADRRAAWDAVQRAGKLQEAIAEATEQMRATKGDIDFVLGKIKQKRKADDDEDGDDEAEEDDSEEDDSEEEAAGGDEEANEDDDDTEDEDAGDEYSELEKKAKALKKTLKELDERFRTPEDAKGIVGGTYALGELGTARWFLGSTWDRPSETTLAYLKRAETLLQEILVDFNEFFASEVPEFRSLVEESDLSLFPAAEPITIGSDS